MTWTIYKVIDNLSMDSWDESRVHDAASMQKAIEYCMQHGGHHTAPAGILGVIVKDKNNIPRFRIDRSSNANDQIAIHRKEMDDEKRQMLILLAGACQLLESAVEIIGTTMRLKRPETAQRLKDRHTWTAAILLTKSAQDQIRSEHDSAIRRAQSTAHVETAISLAQCDDPEQYRERELALGFLVHPNEPLAQARAKLRAVLSIMRERAKVDRKKHVRKYGRS